MMEEGDSGSGYLILGTGCWVLGSLVLGSRFLVSDYLLVPNSPPWKGGVPDRREGEVVDS